MSYPPCKAIILYKGKSRGFVPGRNMEKSGGIRRIFQRPRGLEKLKIRVPNGAGIGNDVPDVGDAR